MSASIRLSESACLPHALRIESPRHSYTSVSLPAGLTESGRLQDIPTIQNPPCTYASVALTPYATLSESVRVRARLENPPWASEPSDVPVAPDMIIASENYWRGWFAHTLLAKIDSIDTSLSPALNRHVLLARYDSDLRLRAAQYELLESTLCSPVTVQNSPLFLVASQPFTLRNPGYGFLRSSSFQYAHVVLISFFWNLIDRIADYFNECAQAWASWKVALVLLAYRQQIKSGLTFKSRHNPLSLFRQSLHPIEQAA